jgi:hypothetical protein
MTPTRQLCLIVALAAGLPGQQLRNGIADADLVAVARQAGRKSIEDGVVAHRMQIVEGLRGRHADRPFVTLLEWTKESHHNRPTPRQQRLYCMVDASRQAGQLGLAAADGPYYKLVGHPGSSPSITGDREQNAVLRFARALCASFAGEPASRTAQAAMEAALDSDATLRLEGTRLLAERPLLRAQVTGPQWSNLVSRLTGETEDIPYKTALAELCAEQGIVGLADALVISLDSVHDAGYARTVGRLCGHLQGDAACTALLRRARDFSRGDEHRRALLVAVGATQTTMALEALLELQRGRPEDQAVEAGLREMKSERAKAAVEAMRKQR